MRTRLLVVIFCVTLVDTVVFSVTSGCGIFQAVPLVLGWHIVRICSGAFFADNHAHIVAAVGALLGAFFLAAILVLLALGTRERDLPVSQARLTKMFAIGTAIYLALSLIPIPGTSCF
jgi:hypothetical protein